MLVVQDLTTCEETESMTVQPGQDTSDSDINPGNVLQGVHAIFSLFVILLHPGKYMLKGIHGISLLVILLHPGKYMLQSIHAVSLLVSLLHPGKYMLQLVVVDEGQCYCNR